MFRSFFSSCLNENAKIKTPPPFHGLNKLREACTKENPAGIDISHFSGSINWQLVKNNILTGAYHFYVTEDDPDEQLKLFLSQIKGKILDIHPIVDIEVIGKNTPKNFVKNLKKFLSKLEKEIGIKPIIYTSHKFWNKHIKLELEEHLLWVAEYGVDKPTLPHGWDRWTIWQYEGNKRLPGIEKDVDLSYYNCNS